MEIKSYVDFLYIIQYSYQDFCCSNFHTINSIWKTQGKNEEVIMNALRKNYDHEGMSFWEH